MKSKIVLLLSLLIFFAACSRQREGRDAAQANPSALKVPVSVVKVEVRSVERALEMVGTLMPYEEVNLASEVPGAVSAVYVDLGDRVEKGQLLIRLDERDYRLQYQQASAAVEWAKENLEKAKVALEAGRADVATAKAEEAAAKAELERARVMVGDAKTHLGRMTRLSSEGIVSLSERDTAQTRYDSALAQLSAAEAAYKARQSRVQSAQALYQQLESAIRVAQASVTQAEANLSLYKKRLDDTSIYAPISGSVQKKMVSVGESIKERVPLLTLVVADPLKLEGEVPERFAPQVRLGQKVRVQVEAYPGETFRGRISRLSPAVTAESRSFRVQALIDNRDGRLKPGFFARSRIITEVEQVSMVPEKALVTLVGLTKLFVIKDGTATSRPVQVGLRDKEMVEVEGVEPGALVATSNLSRLADGVKVNIVESR